MIPFDEANYLIDSCRTDRVLEYPARTHPLIMMLNVLRAHRASIQVAR